MRSGWLLLLAGLLLSGPTARAQDDAAVPPLTITRLSGDVYMLRNEAAKFIGGNVAVLAGDDGLVVVDSQGGSYPQLLLDALKKISAKPVRYVINTHCHDDHTGGNAALQKVGATVIAQDNVRRRLEANKGCTGKFAAPSMTFGDGLTLRLGEETVRITKLETGHTDGDSIVYFTKANVVATGDVFVSNALPYYSRDTGGKLLGTIEQLRQLVALVPEDAQVIPGHGPRASMADVKRTVRVFDEITGAISEQIRKGSKLHDLQAERFLSPWTQYIVEADQDIFLRDFYDALRIAL